MNSKVLSRTWNTLQLQVKIIPKTNQKISEDKSVIYFCGSVKFQLSVTCSSWNTSSSYYDSLITIFAKYDKANNDDLTYSCNIKISESPDSQGGEEDHSQTYLNAIVFKEDSIWQKLSDKSKNGVSGGCKFNFVIEVKIDLAECATCAIPFESLYDDTELSDFELRGTNGSVKMHKTILAAYSSVLKTMLSGKWKEAEEGHVQIDGVTRETLQHLKDYMYLQKLPDSGLEPLLLLGSYYLMPELVQKCSIKFLNNLSADNYLQSMEFAGKYKITNLILEIVNCAPFLKVTDRKYSWLTVCAVTNSSLTEQE